VYNGPSDLRFSLLPSSFPARRFIVSDGQSQSPCASGAEIWSVEGRKKGRKEGIKEGRKEETS